MLDIELTSSELTEDELLETCMELRDSELTDTELDAIEPGAIELDATELTTVTELDWVGCVNFPPEPPQPIINALMATVAAIIFCIVDP
ncbi:hypothetical protein B0D95_15045 [Cellvibrio sp. PSBB023]|nr:hypothetical protein B0D95_15045 [Cellvibrio sp. PSBB023]